MEYIKDTNRDEFYIWEQLERENSEKKKSIRDKIITDNMVLVEILAKKMYKYCGGAIELEELLSYGHLGLIDSVDKFNYKKGIKFVTYATYRIRGAMLDNIRTLDWVPKTLKKKSSDLVKAKDRLSSRKSNYTIEELIEESGLTLEEIRKIEMELDRMKLCSLDEVTDEGFQLKYSVTDTNKFNNPETYVEEVYLTDALEKALELLRDRDRLALNLYYIENLAYKEVGYVLGISESRSYQLVDRALKQLKCILERNGIHEAS